MSVIELRAHPKGPWASEVNVLELNRILRDLDSRLERLSGVVPTEAASVAQIVSENVNLPSPAVATFDLTATYHNFPLADATTVQRFTTGGATRNISGFVQSTFGRQVLIWNVDPSGGLVRLFHENAGSLENNRLICQGSVTIPLVAGAGASAWYDGAVGRWRVAAFA